MLITLRVRHAGLERVLRTERDTITIGRAASCVVVLSDPGLSRTHCQLERTGARLFVRDLNSRNGTFVGGERIMKSLIRPGEEVSCGSALITFERMDPSPAAEDPGLKTVEVLLDKARPVSVGGGPEVIRLRRMLDLLGPLLRGERARESLHAILDSAIALLGAERGFLIMQRADGPVVEIARAAGAAEVPLEEVVFSRGILARVMAAGVPLLVEDASLDQELGALRSVHELQLRAILCVPIQHPGSSAALWLDSRRARGGFDHRDLALVPVFSELVAAALVAGEKLASAESRVLDLEEDVERTRAAAAELSQKLDRALGEEPLRHDFRRIPAGGRVMRTALRVADRAAASDLPVVFLGAAGTGKEFLARAVHAQSARRGAPFVSLLCAALPEGLVESELFGHARGSFTGATADTPGLVGAADKGTLFLDGLQDMSLAAQAAVLRLVEYGEYRRVGESKVRRADVRIMSSSQVPLDALVASGKLRSDLRFRLEGLCVNLPTLLERPEDLSTLVDQLLLELASDMTLPQEARRRLAAHDWPGNLVELRAVLARLGALRTRQQPTRAEIEAALGGRVRSLHDAVSDLERRLVERALESAEGNFSQAARELGLSRPGLRKMLRRLGLATPPADVN
jgi:Nif-specific regulatory protein